MKERPKIDLGMTGYEEMFMNDQERADNRKPKVDELPITELYPFKDHPFKVTEGEEMERLKESIRESGVLVPALARPRKGGGYELISGHRRMAACKALGLETLPVIVRDLTDEEAIITMVDANLQREHILPSEKAFAYKMKLEAMKHQGKRTSDQLGQKYSVEEIADNSPDSKSQIQRYIRLTELVPDILQMVDDGKIALTPAVELSYLADFEQEALLRTMDYYDVTPSLSQAQRMRRMSEDRTLTEPQMQGILSEVKGNQKEVYRMRSDTVREITGRTFSPREFEEFITNALKYYQRHLEREKGKEER